MGADLARIATNIPAMQNMNTLSKISDKIAQHQWRIATGKRINSPEEDPAGYLLARGLESRRRGLSQALSNVSNAQNILDVGAGGYESIMDKLQTLKEKATQAADGSLSSTQRAAIDDQKAALILEIDQIVTSTTFNGQSLIDGTYSATSFQVGEQASETMAVNLGDSDSAALGISTISMTTSASANAAMAVIDSAINTLADRQMDLGQYQTRLSSKEANLKTQVTKTEAVRSTIEDADFAKEQMEVMKLQILQQTSLSSLSQANTAPQLVLSLFR